MKNEKKIRDLKNVDSSEILVIVKADPDLIIIPDEQEITEKSHCECFPQEKVKSVNIKDSFAGNQNERREDYLKRLQESAADSSSCGGSVHSDHYQKKLLSTMQVLENKEETMRIQNESLAVAEARIAVLMTKLGDMRREVDRKEREIQSLRQTIENSRIEKIDTSIDTQTELELLNQNNVVKTLQDNLSVIEELYRECFYETAQQDDLIGILRKSILDIRMIERDKTNQIDKLQTVVKTQQWSLDKCQDIALEVETLKQEISNFLSSSNNDSGMWERSDASLASGVGEDLHDIMDHLLRLRDMLTGGCICGLQDENLRLKQENEDAQDEVKYLRKQISDLQSALDDEKLSKKDLKQLVNCKDDELKLVRSQVSAMEGTSRDHSAVCDSMSAQLHHTQVKLEDKTEELKLILQKCVCYEKTVEQMREELQKTDNIVKENNDLRAEVSTLLKEVSQCRLQLSDTTRRHQTLKDELNRAKTHIQHVDEIFRVKASEAGELERELRGAWERGAGLCAGAGRAVVALRHWVTRARLLHHEQEETIKTQEDIISSLKERLGDKDTDTFENEKYCSKCISRRRAETTLGSASCCSSNEEKRRTHWASTSGSEMASCSSAPVPPKRMFRKHNCSGKVRVTSREAGAQCPVRRHVATHPLHDVTRSTSPMELLERVSTLSAALGEGRRRWCRGGRHTDL